MAHILRLAVASTVSLPGAVEENLRQIKGFARRAGADGVQLLLTPEMSASGYGNRPEIFDTAEVAGQGRIYEVLAAAAEASDVVICAGFVEAREGKKHLSHYIIAPDGSFLVQRKHRLTLSEQPLEPMWPQEPPFGEDGTGTAPRIEFEVFEIDGIKTAISICADTGIENLDDMLDELGVRLQLAPTGAGGSREDRVTTADLATEAGRETYQRVLQTVFFPGSSVVNCVRHRRALAAVNLCGYDGHKHYHVGHGMIISPMGEVPAFFHGIPNLDRQRPMYAFADIDFDDHV